MSLLIPNNMTLKEIERFMDAKRKREAKTRENLKRIGEAAAVAAGLEKKLEKSSF